jgi:general secretion pathway protein D
MLEIRGKIACEEPVIKSLFRLAIVILLVLAVALPAVPESAKSLYNKGKDAEARQNYEQAYDFYKQAYGQKPQDVSYRASYERLRFLAGASHVHRGQLLREAGRLDDALAEFQKGAEIDPSSAIARQEVVRTQQAIDAVKAAGPKASIAPPAVDRRLQEAAGPVELAAIPNIPITLKMTTDAKVVYETMGRLAGINVLFDPDYTSRQIKVDLNSVSLEEGLEITAMESKTFWRPVTPNTIFIAADNPAKRKEVEQSVIKTLYLANLSQPTELQDVVNALRQILEISKLQPLPSEGAIIVRGTPDQIALAEKLVGDLDKSKPEVIVDVAIMQVSRDKTRTLGINPPTSATVQLQPNINTNTSAPAANGSSSTPASNNNGITLNALGNLNATDFQVTISQATATALFSDSNSKLIQNPQIRAVDGQKATLKIGQRIPIASGSFQPGIGGVGINPLVNTQFQYTDVGVNIDITPKVHSDGEITLKIAMEVSSVDSFQNIGGISQPVIGQRKIDHEVRLREGEANLLGGMLEDSQTKSLSGIPGLSQIPILKYLFGQTNTEHRETETVFVLIPHIVRGQVLTELNQRGIDVGTFNSIALRRMSHSAAGTPETSTPGAGSPSAVSAPQSVPQTPPQVSPATLPTQSTGTASFGFDPPSISQTTGSTFAVNIVLSGVQNAFSVPLQVNYDPKTLQVLNVSNGTFLSQDGQIVTIVKRDDDTTGTLQLTATRPPGSSGVSGQGSVATLTFRAKAHGQSTLAISKGGARDPAMQALPVAGTVAQVTVQ